MRIVSATIRLEAHSHTALGSVCEPAPPINCVQFSTMTVGVDLSLRLGVALYCSSVHWMASSRCRQWDEPSHDSSSKVARDVPTTCRGAMPVRAL